MTSMSRHIRSQGCLECTFSILFGVNIIIFIYAFSSSGEICLRFFFTHISQ